MVSIQPGEIFRTSESTSPGAPPLTAIAVTELSPLISGQTVRATVSTPGVARSRSITWLQNTGGWGRWVVVSRLRMRSAENPVGWFESRSNDVTNSPATKWTTKQKATCAAISTCIRRRRECGSSPPLSALTGLTEEARSAGSMPNRNVTQSASASAKPSTPPVRGKRQASRVARRINHPKDMGRGPPRKQRAQGRGEEGQPGALHENQLHQTPSPCADRYAQRHLTRPRRRLRRHQVGDVGAGDQQHQHHENAERHEGYAVVSLQVGTPRRGRLQQELLLQKLLEP